MTVTLHPDVDQVVETAKRTRAIIGDGFMPMLHVRFAGSLPDLLLSLPHGFTEIMEQTAGRLGTELTRPISWMAFIADSHRLKNPEAVDVSAPAGTLAARFRAGDPAIGEGLVVNIIGRAGNLFAFVPYTRDSVGLVWGEMSLHPNTDGRVVNALTRMVEASWKNREDHP